MCRPVQKIKIRTCMESLQKNFSKFKDPRNSALIKIKLEDFLMSSYAVFALKYPSLLSFETSFYRDNIEASTKGIFEIDHVPSDTHLRDVIDEVDDREFRRVFKSLFNIADRSKLLERYRFINIEGKDYYLAAGDGTGYFSSHKIMCSGCTVYHEGNDERATRFGHQVFAVSLVHPDMKQVLPFCPEPIYKEDGSDKNDCELNAFKRFIADFRREHPKLNTILLADALFTNNVAIGLLRENNIKFILNVKTAQKSLLSHFRRLKKEGKTGESISVSESGIKIKKRIERAHRYINDFNLSQAKSSEIVSFIELVETITWTDKDGNFQKEQKTFNWVTDIYVTKDNVEQLARGGRTRWKIENETFNTLKNHGYNLEHNYGHGKKNLSKNLINMMFTAFFIDEIQKASCQKFKKILEKYRPSFLWQSYRTRIEILAIESWEMLYGLILGEIKLTVDSS